MSVPWNLHCLYSLDPSSLDFPRRLHSLIRHDEEEQHLSNLQGSQLARLVDFLDEVRAVPSGFYPLYETLHRPLVPSPQLTQLRENV